MEVLIRHFLSQAESLEADMKAKGQRFPVYVPSTASLLNPGKPGSARSEQTLVIILLGLILGLVSLARCLGLFGRWYFA